MPSESTSVTINTSQARQNIKQLNAEIRALESGFKAATAGMGSWSDSMTGNEARQKALTDILEAQGEKIEMLNALYDEAVAKYGENSVQANNLKTQINNETAAMVENQGELAEVSNRLDEMSDSAGDAGDETGDLSDALDDAGGSAGDAAGSIGDFAKQVAGMALDAAVSAVQALASALWDAVNAGYAWATSVGQQADDWNTMASVTGISAEKLQEWSYASQFVDTDLGTITGSMRRLTMAIGDAAAGNDTAIGKFDSLGVSFQNADGSARDTEAVFWDVIDALGQMTNPTERDAAAMDLLGRSAQELNPLIDAGKDKFAEYGEEAHALGVVLSDDQLNLANSFNDAQNRMQSTAQGTANIIGTILIPAFQPLLDIATDTLSAINGILGDGIQEGDGEAIAGELRKAWESVKEWWNSDDVQSIITAITTIGSEMITGLVDWLTSEDARNDITEAINGFFDWLNEDLGDGQTRLMGIAQTIATTLGAMIEGILQSLGPIVAAIWNGTLESLLGDSDSAIANWIRENMMLEGDFLTSQPGEAGLSAAEELAALHARDDVYDVHYTSEGGGRWTYKEFDPNAIPETEQKDLTSALDAIEQSAGGAAAAMDPLAVFLAELAESGGSVEESGKNLQFFQDMVESMSDAGLDAAEQLEMLYAALDELSNQDDGTDLKGRWTEWADTWNSEFDAAASSAAEAGADAISASADSFAASGAACAAAWLAGANSVRPGAAKTFNSARLQRAYGVTRK